MSSSSKQASSSNLICRSSNRRRALASSTARPAPSSTLQTVDDVISRSSSSASSSRMMIKSLQLIFVVGLLLHCSVSMSSGRMVGHHHSQHLQQLLDSNTEVISMLDGDVLLEPSSLKTTDSDDAVCAKSSDRQATIVRSLSKTTGQPVLLLPQQHFKVAYCEPQQSTTGNGGSGESESCATGSNCATIYRWAKAKVHPPKGVTQFLNFGTKFEIGDDVLVPMDCLCVLSWAQTFRGKGPIVLG
ncbi:hypothetical protein GPALN_006883 [Globodera pallida]|uniref:Peptidase A1 domain-containing protein n=1 Tax=Globodera pallida TaxID=36090 RepID=A0A183C143_GLOPA|nr:hypothetical protein GPALN_006883 [Globodera pallida]